MLRDSLRGFLAAAMEARKRPQSLDGHGGGDFGDLDQAGRAGRRRARLRFQRGRLARDPGGDGRTWPRRVPGADVVGRALQSRRFRAVSAEIAVELLAELHAGDCARGFLLRRARSRSPMPVRSGSWTDKPADCCASSRSLRAARTLWSRSRGTHWRSGTRAAGVELEPTRAMGAAGLYRNSPERSARGHCRTASFHSGRSVG